MVRHAFGTGGCKVPERCVVLQVVLSGRGEGVRFAQKGQFHGSTMAYEGVRRIGRESVSSTVHFVPSQLI